MPLSRAGCIPSLGWNWPAEAPALLPPTQTTPLSLCCTHTAWGSLRPGTSSSCVELEGAPWVSVTCWDQIMFPHILGGRRVRWSLDPYPDPTWGCLGGTVGGHGWGLEAGGAVTGPWDLGRSLRCNALQGP